MIIAQCKLYIFHIRQIREEKWEYNAAIRFIDIKKACDSVRRQVVYNIFVEFCITMKLVALIKMCLNETYSIVRVGKYLSDRFPTKNGESRGCFIAIAFQLCFRLYH